MGPKDNSRGAPERPKTRFHVPTAAEIRERQTRQEEQKPTDPLARLRQAKGQQGWQEEPAKTTPTVSTLSREARRDALELEEHEEALGTSIVQPTAHASSSTPPVVSTSTPPLSSGGPRTPTVLNGSGVPARGVAGPSTSNLNPPAPSVRRRHNAIGVSITQKGNPILPLIRNVPWEYSEVTAEADYVLGSTTAALFLSLKYHRLHPEYIYRRLERWRGRGVCRILLVLIDIEDHRSTVRELSRISVSENCTLILAWSASEAARYLETFKAYEHRPPDALQERLESMYLGRMTNVLTQVRGVNKTDTLTLTTNFGSLNRIAHAERETLAACPGIGPSKAARLAQAFSEPFIASDDNGPDQAGS